MKPFWDVEENEGFVSIPASDGLYYNIWDTGSLSEQQQCAEILAKVRYNINTILFYLLKNPQLWHDKPIAFGIYHTFDIHLPNWENVLSNSDPYTLVNQNNPFIYQEMTPNDYGILGLNKPKEIITIKADTGNGIIDYELGKRRLILITLRNMWGIRSFKDIMDLAIHELTHTTCNDVRWKKDNHRDPYPVYHKWMRQWAKDCGVI